MLLQIVAGVWHGLFPGYALFFVTSAFMFESAKVIYRYERVRSQSFPRPWLCAAAHTPEACMNFTLFWHCHWDHYTLALRYDNAWQTSKSSSVLVA